MLPTREGGNLQVFVSGTWKESKAVVHRAQAELLGQRIAGAGLDLACGPGTGVARYVIDGYRSVETRGTVRFYLPVRSEMEAVGEPVGAGADEIVETEFDYPMRNVWQVKQCSGLFVLTGGDGTLEEIVPAIIDYRIPVAIVENSGTAATAVRGLIRIYPEWAQVVLFGSDVGDVFDRWLEMVRVAASE